jgi:arylsulfatase A-like enzyme
MLKNIILITADCLRADHVSCVNKHSPVQTRFIDNLSKKGLVFTNAYSVSSWTYPSCLSLHTSLYPSSCPTDFLLPPSPTLAEVLKENGYYTAAFISNPWLTKLHGFQRGFDKFCDTLYWQANFGESKDKFLPYSHTKGSILNKYASEWIQSVNSPFFIWLHYMEIHSPIKSKADRFIFRFSKKLGRRKRYSRHVKITDSLIESLFSTIGSEVVNNSLIIITADHGHALGEHEFYGHSYYLFRELVHIPIIIVYPALQHKVYKNVVSLIDIPSTILKLNEIDIPSMWNSGNLVSDKNDTIIGEDYLTDKKISHREWERKSINLKGIKYFIAKDNVHFVCTVDKKNNKHPQVCWEETNGVNKDTTKGIEPFINKILSHITSMKKQRTDLENYQKSCHSNKTNIVVTEEEKKIICKRLEDLGYIE